VKRPEPAVGMVVRYDYVWHSEAEAGRTEGSKIRPCAIVVARIGEGEGVRVLLAPITHTAPRAPDDGLEIPAAVKRRLGLDDVPSWIVTAQTNSVVWTDPGIVPVSRTQWAYGFLPSGLARSIRDSVLKHFARGRLAITKRQPE
jgi:mRNA-degrading endonuclease toxin of MazEF toxin-antitoxin module